MNFVPRIKQNNNNKKKTNSNQMPDHTGLVEKLRRRNAALEQMIKKSRGK